MRVLATRLPGVLLFEPDVFADDRGLVYESYRQESFCHASGWDGSFVQENHCVSLPGVLRGLHYQLDRPQGKLVRVTRGAIFDVAVDLRRSSPTFGRWVGEELSAGNRRQMWVPPGFAHGFLALEAAEVHYKLTDYYAPSEERAVAWDDPDLAIDWPLAAPPQISARDAAAGPFKLAQVFS